MKPQSKRNGTLVKTTLFSFFGFAFSVQAIFDLKNETFKLCLCDFFCQFKIYKRRKAGRIDGLQSQAS